MNRVLAQFFYLGSFLTAGVYSAGAQTLPQTNLLGSSSTGIVYSNARTWQNYSYTFAPVVSGSNYVGLAFRQDPAYWTAGNVVLVQGNVAAFGTNLLTNSNFATGGALPSGTQAPRNWGVFYQTGTPPAAAGTWYGPTVGGTPPSTSGLGVNTASAGSWYDGAVGSYDGIYQGVTLTAGQSYTFSFSLYGDNATTNGGAVGLGAYSGACVNVSAAPSSCQLSGGFTTLATPAEGAAAGGGGGNSNIVGTGQFSDVNNSLSSRFDGGTLSNPSSASTAISFTITGNGGSINAAGNQLSFTGVIADDAPGTPGALTVTSTVSGGSVVLQGVNTYTGATTINSGATLALSGTGSVTPSSGVAIGGAFDISGTTSGASVKAISGAGSVALGSQTLTLTQATGSFSGAIGGSTGGLSVAGGSQTLTGTNTYAGSTRVASGATLSIGAGGTTGSIGSGTVVNSGTLVLNRSNAYTFTNALSGGGALTITGGGDVTVTSPTGALGAVTITGNTVAHFNTVTLNNSSHADAVPLNANLSPNMLFSGSSLSVASGSTLRGAGFINAPTTVAGTLRPGNSPGTLVFGGSVTQAANSVLALDIDGQGTAAGAGNYSSVIVSGTGNTYTANGTVSPILRGITGSANNNYSPAVGSLFTVVSATGGVLGSFTGITQPGSGLLPNTQFDSIYNPNTLQLAITPSNLGGIGGLTPNEAAVGGALQAVRPTPGVRKSTAQATVYDALYKLSAAGYAPAYDRISFAIYGDALMAQGDAAGLMGSTVADQMAQRRGASLGADGKTQKYCLDGDKPSKDQDACRQLTVWGNAVGQFGRTGSTSGDPGYKTDNRGLMLGADMEVENNVRVGAFAGYAAGSVNSPATASKADLTTWSAGVYGAVDRQDMFINALAGFVSGDEKVTRNPLGAALSGKPNVSGAVFSLELGSRYTMDDIVFEPNVGLKATSLRRGSVNETAGSPLAANLSGDSVNTALATLGGRSIWRTKLENGASVTAVGRAAYGRELGDQGTKLSGAFTALNTSATVASSSRGRDALLGGVTLAVSTSASVDLFVRYDAELRRNASSQSVAAGLKISW